MTTSPDQPRPLPPLPPGVVHPWPSTRLTRLPALGGLRYPVIQGPFGGGSSSVELAAAVEEAVVLEDAGADVVIASGSDAGGHRGAFLRPVEESLVPQVVDAVGVPVVAAGGITDARQVRAAFVLGADAVQIGTGFLVTDESGVPDVHKDALAPRSRDGDGPQRPRQHTTVLTAAFTGRLARGVPNATTRALTDPAALAPYPTQSALTAPLRRAAAAAGDVDHYNLWSGQSAPLAARTGAVEYLDTLTEVLRDL